jgi:hypothetical protein
MFVIFHDSQAVPEYLVTFKRKWCVDFGISAWKLT